MSIPKEGSRDIGDGIIVSLTPDICKTPVGSSTPPIPYSVFAIQGDDANTAATVRMTSNRAHNMASVVTRTQGDAPGSAGGIKSGTTGAACHPKTHSSNVNIEGKPAIRHTDEWYMNNKNTVGKLTYIDSTESFEHTPAIDLTQNQESLLDDSEVEGIAAANAEYSETVQAIIGGMERARAEGLPAGSYQVAQAQPAPSSPSPTVVPGIQPSNPGTGPIQPGTPANDNKPPSNRVTRSPSTRAGGLAALALALGEVGFSNLMQRDVGRLANNHGIVLDPNDPYERAILAEYSRNRGPSELSRLYRGMDEDEAIAIVRERQAELEEIRSQPDPSEEDQDENTEARSERTPANVRVTGRGEEEEEPDPCEVKRYGSLRCPGGDDQRHHIVPDSALRYGTRSEGEVGQNRIAGLPSLRDGMAICLDGHATVPGTGHNIAHSVTDPMIAAAGVGSAIPGTTTVSVAKEAGIAGATAAKPDCAKEIRTAVDLQYAPIDGNRLVNSTGAPAIGPALDALRAGQ